MASPTSGCAENFPDAGSFLQSFFFSAHYSVELQNVCCRAGVDLNRACDVQFSNNTVASFGNVTRGQFKAQPDVAGLGVLVSVLFPTALINLLAVIFLVRECAYCHYNKRQSEDPHRPRKEFSVYPPRRLYDIIRRLLLGLGDVQLILALVYGINFGISAKCTISAYHYNIAVDTMVIALTCITLSAHMVPEFWHVKLATVLRVFATLVIFAFLLRFLFYQMEMVSNPELMSTYATSRNDSLLFLPMACFLDPDLNPFKDKLVNNITSERKVTVGSSGPRVTPDLVFCVLLAFCYVTVLVIRFIIRFIRFRIAARPPFPLTVLVVPVCIFSCFWCIGHITLVRVWVDKSGWMEKTNRPGTLAGNPENSVMGLGQILPLATMIWRLIASLDTPKQPQSVLKDMSGQP